MKLVSYDPYRYVKKTSKWFLPFAAGILLGFLLFLSGKQEFISDPCFFGEEILQRFAYSSIYQKAFLGYVLKNRWKLFFLFLFSAFTGLYPLIAALLFGWCGMSFAIILMTLLYRYGLKGILLLAGMLFPQMLFYIPCMLKGSDLLGQIYRGRRKDTDCEGNPAGGRNRLGTVVGCVLLFGLFLAGTLTESYVNPMVLKKLIKIL